MWESRAGKGLTEEAIQGKYTYRLIILRIIGIAYCLVFPR